MESVLKSALRKYVSEDYIKNVLAGEYTELYDELGNPLPGIKGRMGVTAVTEAGHDIGVDYICMSPGSQFPLHVHPGDHILYILSSQIGMVHVNGKDLVVKEGDSVFIPAEFPHGVKTHPEATEEFKFLAFGHPHKHLDATDRMHQVNEAGERLHTHHDHHHDHKH